MTDFLTLPSVLDASTIDVESLIERVQAGAVVIDWREVEELDRHIVRSLFEPFRSDIDVYGDALGIETFPPDLEAEIVWLAGFGPEPVSRRRSWLVIQKHESDYSDESGVHYEYPTHIPNGRQIAVGDTIVCMVNAGNAEADGGRIFGVGEVGSIEDVGDGRVQARYDEYLPIDPMLSLDLIGGDPRNNGTNSINRIPNPVADRVRAVALDAELPTVPVEVDVVAASMVHDLDLTTAEGVRDAMSRLVAIDLLGPANGPEEELVEDNPSIRYVVGALAPRRSVVDAIVTDDPLAGSGEGSADEGGGDGRVAASNTLFSSSIGFTFVVSPDVQSIEVHPSWGDYERVQSDGQHETAKGTLRMVWRRRPRGESFELPLGPGRLETRPADSAVEGVYIEGIVRPSGPEGTIVTLFLVNDREEVKKNRDQAWVFQPELRVTALDGESPVFERRDVAEPLDENDHSHESEERALLSMSHRKHAEFAIGHGVGVTAAAAADPWNDDAGWGRATAIATTVLPEYDVPVTQTPDNDELGKRFDGFKGFELDQGDLATLPDDELIAVLRRIPDTYAEWIKLQSERVGQDPTLTVHEVAARRALERAELARKRLAEGVDILVADPDALRAFRFTNEVMRTQRLRSLYARDRRRGIDTTLEQIEADEGSPSWRAFQLAFVLLNVPTVTRLDHQDRNGEVGAFADLLWFPTGGGKTEAYLGVATYSIAIRRLQGSLSGYDADGGVSVIMRYTLRLLTLQQFQRAATLVCAMEDVRLRTPAVWGSEPFRIGLWVGGSSTPNTTGEAKRWADANRGSHNWNAGEGTASPLQLTNCPWCGAKLSADNLTVRTDTSGLGRTLLHCRERECDFTQRQNLEGIPVVTVDEEIYRLLPTFLLATVDKFAQMPWRGEVQALFGRVASRCDRHGWLGTEPRCSGNHPAKGGLPATKSLPVPTNGLRPPDLIIQDELHLISGPLGTLVGLYETAVDRLCTWEHDGELVRAKVIAATATTRRAPEQVHQLFGRRVEVFPPIGLDADDNFFSRQRATHPTGQDRDRWQPGRRYMGVCAPGRSRPAVLIRVYVAVLTVSKWLFENVDPDRRELADPYMTLLGYFNSLRELGGMRRLVDDDVSTRVFRVERDDRPGMAQRSLGQTQELTSRIRSSKIPELLDQLEVGFHDEVNSDKPRRPLDVVLATNMVSVGVDVSRLGVMVVSGQPKATAEYIQASSRVGRADPGFVVTVLNWARPRDLSHYEQFEHYHAVFYRYVEALSVTPFAPRALSRGLTGVVASLVRLEDDAYNPNHGAAEVTGAGQFPEVIDAIGARAQNATFPGTSHEEVGQHVRRAVTSKLDAWGAEAAVQDRKLGYRKPRTRDDVTVPLLEPAGNKPWGEFTTPTSMREVEPGVGLVLDTGGDRDLPPWNFGSKPKEEDE